MKHLAIFCSLLLALLFAAGCSHQSTEPAAPVERDLAEQTFEQTNTLDQLTVLESRDLVAHFDGRIFLARLSGKEEVPPVDTRGFGFALFHLNRAKTELSFKLFVFLTPNVTQAHIHVGPRGQNGPIVAFLFGFVPEGVTVNGLLSKGTVTASNLVGPLAGKTIADLAEEMLDGNTYTNVHTIAHPPGEIRGQNRALGRLFIR